MTTYVGIPVLLVLSPGWVISAVYLASVIELVRDISDRSRKAVQDYAEQQDAHGQWKCRFPYTDTFVRLCLERHEMEQGATPLLVELIALGVEFDYQIDIHTHSILGKLPISKLSSVLHAMTDGPSLRAVGGNYEKLVSTDRDTLSLQNWDFERGYHTRRLQAICSSLSVCQGICEVEVSNLHAQVSRQCMKKILPWLAYALFSNESMSNVTSVSLREMTLEKEDVAVMMDVL